ncbi:MAG: amino acid adenylation domain-containing protein [Clostridiales Family XIII bacterium]|jgi:amino acid adenylation domain-containing protein|nr:amino acid adenylation domain-containing protein [Clostridiales Family XIII bacterium]
MNKEMHELSNPQKSIWYTEQFFQGTSINSISATMRMQAPINFKLLELAINETIKNNDAMRLRVTTIDGEPCQYAEPYAFETFSYEDFSARKKSDLFQWDIDESAKPIFKENAPLYQFVMIQFDETTAGYLTILHHIITDAWSSVLMGDEIMEHYDSLMAGNLPASIDDKRKPSYLDFLEKEKEYLVSERYRKDKTYWMDLFDTFPEPTTLKPIKEELFYSEAIRKAFTIPTKYYENIAAYLEEANLTVFVGLLSAFVLYLSRVTGKDDIVIGIPVLNRTNRTERVTMGMFISTVPFRIQVDSSDTYADFAKKVGAQWMKAMRHQRYPFEQTLRYAREHSGVRYEQLYDIVFSYQNAKFSHSESSGKKASRWHFSGHQRESLVVHINDRDGIGQMVIDYDFLKSEFTSSEIASIHNQFMTLTKNAMASPSSKISEIDIINDTEKNLILTKFNNTDCPFPKDKSMLDFFEDKLPDKKDDIAVIQNANVTSARNHLTYGELDARACALARALRAAGVSNGDIVPLMLYRRVDMMVAILGVWKAGAAYLPMDPLYPSERIQYMIQDSHAKVVLTTSDSLDAVRQKMKVLDSSSGFTPDISVICVDTASLDDTQPTEAMIRPTADDVAYVIYTSGSTGQPKGVLVGHRALVNRINWMNSFYPTIEEDVILQKTPYTFDVSVWELTWWFFAGIKMVFLDAGDEKYPDKIADAIEEHNVSIMHFVPSMLSGFMEYLERFGGLNRLSSLRHVFASGEALTPLHANSFYRVIYPACGAYLYNLYGPTEAAIDVTYYNCPVSTDATVIPIGKPIDNIRLYILDRYGNEQPIGVSGELYLGGVGLAKGYLGKPELTLEKFVRNKNLPEPLLYRTGDLAKWLPNGGVIYLGRIDHQIKIRGFRIELGDIRTQLEKHEDISSAIVTSKNNTKDEAYLVAYYISDKEISFDALKSHLELHLPEYMIPSCFVRIDEIPLSANGKADISKLPDPDAAVKIGIIRTLIQPRNVKEELVHRIWSEVLGNVEISVTDDFFKVGGDSLRAIDMVCRMPGRVNIHKIYEHPILEDFAKNFDLQESTKLLALLVGNPEAKETYILCPYGGGGAYSYLPLAEELVRQNQKCNVYSIHLPGHDFGDADEHYLSVKKIAEQIQDEIKTTITGNITIYAHCVGTALGVELARSLVESENAPKALYLGGILPPRQVGIYGSFIDPWKVLSDNKLIVFLGKLGMPSGDFSAEGQGRILSAFRHDVRAYYRYFGAFAKELSKKKYSQFDRFPVITILGDSDLMTRSRRDQEGWQKFLKIDRTNDKDGVHIIEHAEHYFMQTHCTHLAKILINKEES